MPLAVEKKRRFFFHYAKCRKDMTVHFQGACLRAKNVVCKVACETKYNKRQPRLVMRGYCRRVVIKNGTAVIS